ncbi:hypothetical protein Dsin_029995 [Dipteronia sinensis]|uniref:Uncharacterized protein n=1 Tax=Dipteronia sinensis TaxID=43782 RepID=A0AAD9ZK28_9ROSI|nr:hypothetical protein Dsin_029995 [Dipteronia sinensis]
MKRGLFALAFIFLSFSKHFGEDLLGGAEFVESSKGEHVYFSQSDIIKRSTRRINSTLEFFLKFGGERVDVHMFETLVINTTKDVVSAGHTFVVVFNILFLRPPVKEYVQSSALDNCLIPASSAEQYVDLDIGQPLIDQWIREGYSHLHVGAVRIILTLHGRKGLPVTARLALLNTVFQDYEQAVIGTCLSTLHAGSISLTYYPNFNIPLRDANLHNCLKIQLQLMGIKMLPDSYMATLHHQIAYRLQDQALDLPIPGHSGDTIFIKAEREDEVLTILQIPRQLPRDQLLEIMPLSWITNYEKAFQNTIPVIASDTTYTRQPDGTVKTIYKPLTAISASPSEATPTAPTPPSAPPEAPIFQSLMIRHLIFKDDIPIHSFEADGSVVYTDKINGHFIWDADPSMCDPDCLCNRSSRQLLNSTCKPVRHRTHSPDDPDSP